MIEDIDRLVERFLQWKLPPTVCSDKCVTDASYDSRFPGLRSGTNLLTSDEARQMLEHLFGAPHGFSQAARDVIAERGRQISAEGWTPEHDDEHTDGALACAGASYALHAVPASNGFPYDPTTPPPDTWPWDRGWWKPCTARRDLVKAGALIVAEIERLDRAALDEGSNG